MDTCAPEITVMHIPVYRCSQRIFESETKLIRERYRGPASRAWYEQNQWYPQQFNDVVGWLRIYANGDQIRGEEWWVRAKRLSRNMHDRRFLVDGKAFECTFYADSKNQEILGAIRSEIHGLKRTPRYLKRYVDLSCFESVGPFIDWRRILGLG